MAQQIETTNGCNPTAMQKAQDTIDRISAKTKNPWLEREIFLLRSLRLGTDPQTGRPRTGIKLATTLHHSDRWVTRHLQEIGMPITQAPEVRTGPLPENEKAFFQGLMLGGFQVDEAHMNGTVLIFVGTETKKPKRREVLKTSLGTWGTTKENPSEMKIYLHEPTFGFLKDGLDRRVFDARTRFAPFLLGVLTVRLSDNENRISSPDRNPKTLERMLTAFENYFGFALGGVSHRKKIHQDGSDLDTLIVTDPQKVLGALISERSVQNLPFFRDLAHIGK